MKLLGFNFTKFNAEKFSDNKKGVKLSRSMNISDIKEISADMLNTQGKVLAVYFSNTFDYKPDYAKIELEGKVLVSIDEETGKNVVEEWNNNNPVPEDFRLKVLNIVAKKSDLKALQFEEELGIPFHLNLSKVESKKKEESK